MAAATTIEPVSMTSLNDTLDKATLNDSWNDTARTSCGLKAVHSTWNGALDRNGELTNVGVLYSDNVQHYIGSLRKILEADPALKGTAKEQSPLEKVVEDMLVFVIVAFDPEGHKSGEELYDSWKNLQARATSILQGDAAGAEFPTGSENH